MNPFKKHGIALLTGALLLAGFAGNALAAGTPACTTISNQATLSYSVGGVGQTPIDSDGDPAAGTQTTDFQVATKVDLTVAAVNSPVTATGVDQVLTYSITNTGNDTQRYGLQLYAGNSTQTYLTAVDAFNMGNVRVYTDTNSTFVPALTDGETLIANNPANGATMATLTANVAANGVLYVHVVSDVPGGQATGDDAIYTLKAKTYQIATLPGTDGTNGTETGNSATDSNTDNSCATGVALADGASAGGVGTGIGDSTNDGDAYATGFYTVSAANITMTKDVSVLWDPVNGNTNPVAIPGAYVQYVVAVTNNGAAAATLTAITDNLVPTLAIDPDLIDGTGAAPTPGAPESAVGSGFKVVVSGSTRALNGADQYFTTTSSVDGVDFAAPTITATFATILPIEAGYATTGLLKSGETVTLTFNAIIQ